MKKFWKQIYVYIIDIDKNYIKNNQIYYLIQSYFFRFYKKSLRLITRFLSAQKLLFIHIIENQIIKVYIYFYKLIFLKISKMSFKELLKDFYKKIFLNSFLIFWVYFTQNKRIKILIWSLKYIYKKITLKCLSIYFIVKQSTKKLIWIINHVKDRIKTMTFKEILNHIFKKANLEPIQKLLKNNNAKKNK